mgnify:CR=1 FL=1
MDQHVFRAVKCLRSIDLFSHSDSTFSMSYQIGNRKHDAVAHHRLSNFLLSLLSVYVLNLLVSEASVALADFY